MHVFSHAHSEECYSYLFHWCHHKYEYESWWWRGSMQWRDQQVSRCTGTTTCTVQFHVAIIQFPIWKHVIIIRSLYSWTMPFSTSWTMLGPRTTSECISILLQLPLSSSSSCSPCAPLSQPLYCPFVSSTILHIISSQFDVLSRSLWSKRALLEVLIVHLLYIKSFLEMSLITQIDIQHELINQNSGITTSTR